MAILFIFLSVLLILSSIMVINVNNTVYANLFLIFSFAVAASILLLLENEFISLIFIIIYAGAVAVLFLFVIMLLDIKSFLKKNSLKYFPIGNFLGIVFLTEIFLIIFKSFDFNPYGNWNSSNLFNYSVNWIDKIDVLPDIQAVGQVLYTYYVLQFLIAGLILLIAIIGSVVITVKYHNNNNKRQETYKQISR